MQGLGLGTPSRDERHRTLPPMMRRGTESDMKTVLHKSCALVAQTFMLAMSEAGYDTCPVEGFDVRRVRKALGLPSSVEPSLDRLLRDP